ncbi:MAG: tRNA lysidine(34) synthetase TilS [Thermaurantimonas sp.]
MDSEELHPVEKVFLNALSQFKVEQQPILAGVSGGVDSMTMLYLFRKHQKNVIAVHVNYHLRGTDSDEDEQLVRAFCRFHSIPVEVFHFDKSIHSRRGHSLQMAARAFRYEKFFEMKVRYNADYVALGHHWDDYIETFILHMTRGAGLRGLLQVGDELFFLRPLANATKEDIVDYALRNSVDWREDISNFSEVYERNRIRNEILPLLHTLHPRVSAGLKHTLENLGSAFAFIRFKSKEYIQLNKEELHEGYKISLAQLYPWKPAYRALLQEVLTESNIPVSSVDNLIQRFHLPESKIWHSGYPLVFTRNAELYVYPREHRSSKLSVTKEWLDINHPCEIKGWGTVEHVSDNADLWISPVVQLSTLTFRPWLPSDYIFLKDGGRKKVGDVLKDKKLNIVQRNKVLVMTSDSEVVWIVKIQADARYVAEQGTGIGLKARCFWL